MRESEILRSIVVRLRPLLPRLVRVQSGTFRARGSHVHAASAGTPDLLGFCRHGRIVALEVKRPGEVATDEQISFLASVVTSGGIGAVVTSADGAEEIIRYECLDHDEERAKREN